MPTKLSLRTVLSGALSTLALTLAAPATGVAAAPVCANANSSATAAPAAVMRNAVVCLVNQQRAQHHLPPLHASSLLDRSAQAWTNTMVHTGLFSHGADFSLRISAAGYAWGDAGENIAAGYSTPRQVVAGWMSSTGHCQNILSPGFSDVGTGVNPHPLDRVYEGTWTQDFGTWIGHRAPSGNTGPARGCPYRIPAA